MEDVSVGLWEKINSDFNKNYSSNREIKSLLEKVANNRADYNDATRYAEIVGRMWSDALSKHITIDNLPDGKLYFNIANKTIKPALESDYMNVAEFTKDVQNWLNESAQIGLKSVVPPINGDRVKHLIDKIASQDELFGDFDWLIGDGVLENFSRSVVTDFVEANASIQKDAGLKSWIERREGAGGCCKWCQTMVGRYNYGEQPDDFFLVHKDCTCVIEFHPAKRRAERITYSGRRKITTKL